MSSRLFFFLILIQNPTFMWATILDEYSSTSPFTMDINAGASASLSPAIGEGGTAVKMDYSMGSGGYVQMVRDYSSRDFATEGGNSVRFRYRAVGNKNTLELKFTDYDSTDSAKSDKIFIKFLAAPDSQWKTMTLAFASFTLTSDGNGSFDLSKMSKVLFGVNQENSTRGSGTVWFDNIELYKSTVTVIDNFDDGSNPNFMGDNNNAFGGTPGAIGQYVVDGVNKVAKLTYSVLNAGEFAFFTVGLKSNNYQGYTHVSFRIRGNAGGEVLKVKLESLAGANEVFISTYLAGGITAADYQTVNIPVSAFPNANLSKLTVFTLFAGKDFSSGAGSVFIDDVAFVRLGETPGTVRVIDDLDLDASLSNWETYKHDDATLSISAISDISAPESKIDNRVYQYNYSFTPTPSKPNETPWTVMERPLQLPLASFTALRLKYLGTGSSNNLEIKLTDHDNTTWVKRFQFFSNTNGAWKSVVIPLNQFAFFNAGDNGDKTLNLKRIKQVWYAIVKGQGGTGTFAADTLETAEVGQQFEQVDAGRLISSIKILNNPFSPNGDGVKDDVFFVYTLASGSKVSLRVYSMEGDEVKTIAVQDQGAGDQSLTWNGLDNNNEMVPNGVYVIRMVAEGLDNRMDEIKQIVAVLK